MADVWTHVVAFDFNRKNLISMLFFMFMLWSDVRGHVTTFKPQFVSKSQFET
jgi:hypothetical protein